MVISLDGNWQMGKAFDLHTTSSTYLGIDELGHDQFDNTRSEMGELVYQLKYKGNKKAVHQIVNLLDSIGGIEKFDFLIPVPATNKNRIYQPVELIAVELGKRRGVPVLVDLLFNRGSEELKGVTDPVARNQMLKDALYLSDSNRVTGKKLLLVDDLFRSGSTLSIATDILYRDAHAKVVCILAMTKTRRFR